jgi:hypothetical protein
MTRDAYGLERFVMTADAHGGERPATITPFLVCSFLTVAVAVPVAMWLGFKQPRTSRGLAPYLGMSATVSLFVGDRLLRWCLR